MLETANRNGGAPLNGAIFAMAGVRGSGDLDQRHARIHYRGQPGRGAVEAFLEAAYARAFDSVLRRHYPTLLSLHDQDGRILAAAGMRLARDEPLFLEQYLDAPIEVAAKRELQTHLGRDAVAEIGNLASETPADSLALFLALAKHLAAAGCTHAAATATHQLRRKFRRMGFSTCVLAAAQATRVDRPEDWGRYYARDPEVLFGPISPAIARLHAMASGAVR